MSALRHNLLANFAGQAWRAAMTLAFVPVYIRYLGIESYGLIGIYAVLQSSLALLDLGVRPALTREMSRCSGRACEAQAISDLLRSSETLALTVAVLVASATWWWSDLLAMDWVQAKTLPNSTVAYAFSLMGLVASLQFVESLYTGCLSGLQRQVAQNVIMCLVATMRAIGAVAILEWVSPTLTAFFLWQAICSVVGLLASAGVVYRILPRPPHRPQFRVERLRSIWRFASGMLAISALALVLTQVDKILLSLTLSLDLFGYYTLAGSVAGALTLVVAPVTSAYYPRFNQYLAMSDSTSLRAAYHESAQFVSAVVGAMAAGLVLHARSVLLVWTGDSALAENVAPLLSVLALGTLLNGLMWVPYQMQLAHGWTKLAIGINIIAVCTLIPALVWVVPHFGPIGAAWIWVILNAGYVLFDVQLMHRRILPSDKWEWYLVDVGAPLSAAFTVALLASHLLPTDLGRLASACMTAMSIALSLIAAVLAAPRLRTKVCAYLRRPCWQ
jgi:O-antigen/teichoic acid export membrane protein